MTIVFAKEKIEENVAMRDAYCQTLMELAEKDPRIVMLDADLMNSMGMVPFQKKFPDRTFNCGIQEANMIGVAAGLSATGKVPYAHSFATFATRRCFDQIFMSAAYAKLNVRIVGSDPGVTASFNGGTHMPFEDLGIMRNIPEVTVLEPTDSTMIRDIVKQLADSYGVFYMRICVGMRSKYTKKGRLSRLERPFNYETEMMPPSSPWAFVSPKVSKRPIRSSSVAFLSVY